MKILPGKRNFFYAPFSIFLAFIILLPGYMAWEAETPEITVIQLPDAPEGIIFIADPHIRNENIDTVRKVITEINRLEPALVLIGGDFTYPGEEDLSLQEVWKEIDAPVYAVLGNHDYRTGIKGSGATGRISWVVESILRSQGFYDSALYSAPDLPSSEMLREVLEKNGVTVLRNESRELEIRGQLLMLYGMDDIWAGRATTPANLDTGPYVIYFVHEPFYREEWNADLVLAGHTHGGQFNNGVYQILDSLGVVDIRGMSKKNDTVMYVTRGIGTSKTREEYRLFSSPEIVVINPRMVQKG